MSLKDVFETASVRASVRPCVHVFTLSKKNITETRLSITITFYLICQKGRENVSFGFGSDRLSTLVSMATDSSNH